jgi:arylsulfatase
MATNKDKKKATTSAQSKNGKSKGPVLYDTLPIPDPKFKGRIGSTYMDSEPDIISLRTPPEGAPNVLLVLLDDVGFGQTSTFGGPVNTPTLQRLADEGLRFNRFHTTALCSPTRAALLSGRNHHSVHTGVITEMATGFPGYDGSWPSDAACIAEILQGNQYATAAFGKWHNTPDHELSAAGPFDRWPTGKGFGYWYGFQGGEASQWHTPLFENTAPIEPPHDDPKWHFTEAITDRAISWIGQQQAAAPDMPFFIYFCARRVSFPASRAQGVGRQVQRQIRSRLGPPTRTHSRTAKEARPRSKRHEADASARLDPVMGLPFGGREAALLAMQGVFAGFLEHADTQVAKLVDAIDRMGLRENTLIIYIVGDNGPSAEGSLTGTLNNMKSQLGLLDDVADDPQKDRRDWRAAA